MTLFNSFAHYLAYLATDQETFRDLRGSYDGVLVPGTIAAWQRQGTGGFVLSLSATEQAPDYIIDPRFPLFQQALSSAKQSHVALAEIFGDPTLVRSVEPSPGQFGDDRLRQLAVAWVAFNMSYGTSANEKFDKYAERLGEPVASPADAQAPEAILAPYFVAQGAGDPWWHLSKRLFDETRAAAAATPTLRVVAAAHAGILDEVLGDVEEEQLVVWVSGLDEHRAPTPELASYRLALAAASARGQHMFALYGGFFSVLLASSGLDGAAHGVGFSEHRNWRELPTSGAAPARYYMRRWHRYITIDLAQTLWQKDPTLGACACEHCGGRAPNTMTYHDLMKHSVLCRKEEIDLWSGQPHPIAATMLSDEHDASVHQIEALALLPAIRARALESVSHLPRWAAALTADT